MLSHYNSRLFSTFSALQSDLKEKKIDEKEFNFLVGFLLQTEVSKFVGEEIEAVLPKDKNNKSMTLLTYQMNRMFRHAP